MAKTKKPSKSAQKSAATKKSKAGKASKGVSQQLAAQRAAIATGLCPSCFKANKGPFKLCLPCRKLKRGYMQRLRAERSKKSSAVKKSVSGKRGAKRAAK